MRGHECAWFASVAYVPLAWPDGGAFVLGRGHDAPIVVQAEAREDPH